jgi:hypothetical protein
VLESVIPASSVRLVDEFEGGRPAYPRVRALRLPKADLGAITNAGRLSARWPGSTPGLYQSFVPKLTEIVKWRSLGLFVDLRQMVKVNA